MSCLVVTSVLCCRFHLNWLCDHDLTPSCLGHASGEVWLLPLNLTPHVALSHLYLTPCVCVFFFLLAGNEWDGACIWRGLWGAQGLVKPLPSGHVATRGQDRIWPGEITLHKMRVEFFSTLMIFFTGVNEGSDGPIKRLRKISRLLGEMKLGFI